MLVLIDIDENLYTRLFDNGGIDAADMHKACTAIRRGKECNNDWVSVKDGLPKEDGRYLCAVKSLYGRALIQIVSFANNLSEADEFEFNGYNRAGWYDYDSETGYYEVKDVVAWMELPEVYRKGERKMTKAELMTYVGKKVHIAFKDTGGSIYGTLGYVDEFSEKYDFRKPNYFYIGNTSFKVSHVKKVMESEEE